MLGRPVSKKNCINVHVPIRFILQHFLERVNKTSIESLCLPITLRMVPVARCHKAEIDDHWLSCRTLSLDQLFLSQCSHDDRSTWAETEIHAAQICLAKLLLLAENNRNEHAHIVEIVFSFKQNNIRKVSIPCDKILQTLSLGTRKSGSCWSL